MQKKYLAPLENNNQDDDLWPVLNTYLMTYENLIFVWVEPLINMQW